MILLHNIQNVVLIWVNYEIWLLKCERKRWRYTNVNKNSPGILHRVSRPRHRQSRFARPDGIGNGPMQREAGPWGRS